MENVSRSKLATRKGYAHSFIYIIQTWLTEAYFDLILKRVEYLYDVHAAASWTGFSLGRTSLDIVYVQEKPPN